MRRRGRRRRHRQHGLAHGAAAARRAGFEVRVRDIDPAREAVARDAGLAVHGRPAVGLRRVPAARSSRWSTRRRPRRCCSARWRCGRAARPAPPCMLCPTIAPRRHRSACAARLVAHGPRLHRRADVRRPGARARRHDEPDGRLRRRGVRAPPRGDRGAVDAGVPHRRARRATARAPSSSTTCWPASTSPARPRCWRWPSGSGWTRRARWT